MDDTAIIAAALNGSGAWQAVAVILLLTATALAGGLLGGGLLTAALGPERGDPADPRDAVFSVENGAPAPLNRAARRWAERQGLSPDALEPLDADASLATALRALEADGRVFHALARDRRGAEWVLHGRPEGGRPLVRVREAEIARTIAAEQRRRAEAAEAERDLAHAALQASPDLIWRRGRDGALLWANARYLAAAGGRDDDGLPRELDFGGAPPPTLSARPARACIFAAETGERLWLDFREIDAGDGGRLGFGADASAAIHAEAALRRFVETLTETFAHLRIGLAIFDREQRLGLFNPAFAELMELDPPWLASRPGFAELLDRLRVAGRLPEPDDFAGWRQGLLDMFGESSGRERLERQEVWHLPGDVMLRVIARPHPQGAVALLMEDVSETARLERRWHTANDIRRAVIDRLEEGVAAFGPDGRARFANPAFARLWGFRPGDDDGAEGLSEALQRCAELSRPTDAWRRVRAFFAETEGRRPWVEPIATLDGRRLRLRVAALPDGSVLTAFFDETDAVRAAEALQGRQTAMESAEELRGALIEQSSRRLRTPLNTISGYGQMLRDEAGAAEGEERRRAFADGILEAAAEIQRAMGAVSDLASAQGGAIALGSAPVDLDAALDGAVAQAQGAADRQGVRLGRAPAETTADGWLAGDAARVRQLLVNLLFDAIERADWGSEIRCGARRRGDQVEVWTDAPETAEERREGAPRSKGLALSLARRFAEMHGGGLFVERREPAPSAGAQASPAQTDASDAQVGWTAREAALPFGPTAPGDVVIRVTCALPARGPADLSGPDAPPGRSTDAAA
ncbi:MAG: PAS domain-containing sensor histidine kinase [Pseudomonadota bacterium]